MNTIDIQTLVAARLEDLADRVDYLYVNGYPEEAQLLREEGLALASTYDSDHTFLYLDDLRLTTGE